MWRDLETLSTKLSKITTHRLQVMENNEGFIKLENAGGKLNQTECEKLFVGSQAVDIVQEEVLGNNDSANALLQLHDALRDIRRACGREELQRRNLTMDTSQELASDAGMSVESPATRTLACEGRTTQSSNNALLNPSVVAVRRQGSGDVGQTGSEAGNAEQACRVRTPKRGQSQPRSVRSYRSAKKKLPKKKLNSGLNQTIKLTAGAYCDKVKQIKESVTQQDFCLDSDRDRERSHLKREIEKN